MPQHLPRLRPGVLAIADDQDPIHEDVRHACRKSVWPVECGRVPHGRRIEEHDVSRVALPEKSPARKSELLRRKRRHFANRLLERNHFAPADVLAEDSDRVAIAAWVRRVLAGTEHAAI